MPPINLSRLNTYKHEPGLVWTQLFHATSEDALASIAEHGLRATGVPGWLDDGSWIYFANSVESAMKQAQAYGKPKTGLVVVHVALGATLIASDKHPYTRREVVDRG